MLVQAFVSSRLDYCNSLLYGITDRLMQRVQSVQNAAARLVTGARRSDHITPVLLQLHWLPVRQRVDFRVIGYWSSNLWLAKPRSTLLTSAAWCQAGGRHAAFCQYSDVRGATEARTRNRFGDRSFSVAGPRLWNALPSTLQQTDASLTHWLLQTTFKDSLV